MTETEASECGLEVFYEKCMTLIDKLEHIGLCKEEFLILKVKQIPYSVINNKSSKRKNKYTYTTYTYI